MDVRIDEIHVESVGPIKEAHFKLGLFNLIFGRNEEGKTFLVEFVTRSLFKHITAWPMRSTEGRGKVVVSGLDDSAIELMPSSRQKLEDYLGGQDAGLPSRISRLLIVKGADLNFDDKTREGINGVILKEFLSGERILDDIQENISPTVQRTSIKDGLIDGPKMGENKKRDSLEDSLRRVDRLFEEIETVYSGGERQQLAEREAQLKEQIDLLEEARRHQAYLLHQELIRLQSQIDRLPKEPLSQAEIALEKLRAVDNKIARYKRELAESERQSAHFDWLGQAINWYEIRGVEAAQKMNPIYPILIILFLIVALLLMLLDFVPGAIALIIAAILTGVFTWQQMEKRVQSAVNADELKRLSEAFEKRFGEPFSGLPRLNELKKKMEAAYFGASKRREDLEQEKTERISLSDSIAALLVRLTGEDYTEERWLKVIQDLQERRDRLQRQYNETSTDLARLNVPEELYREEPAAVEHDLSALQQLREKLEQVQSDLSSENIKLDNLKQNICAETTDEISADWEMIIHHLQQRRQEISDEYRKLTSEIIAGILVTNVLNGMREEEKEKIKDRLAKPAVQGPVFKVTGHYRRVDYEDEQIWAVDEFGRFKVSELSTGAREQVLLGLRLGFAAHIFKRNRLFLLLDDAFQHADWQRRELLVNQAVALAQAGWQITYFTMDDHIKDLFEKAGWEYFREQYSYHELATG